MKEAQKTLDERIVTEAKGGSKGGQRGFAEVGVLFTIVLVGGAIYVI